jgi:outer membrane protein OmpA-like peptidoglycan-associated protein
MTRTIRAFALLSLLSLVLGVAACDPSQRQRSGRPVTITEPAVRSVLVAVVPGTAAGGSLARLVAATARPAEDLDILRLRSGAPARVLIASDSPAPVREILAGKPTPPGADPTSYQKALYGKSLQHWQGELTSARRAVTARTRAAIARWASALEIPARLSDSPAINDAAGTLASECAAAVSALADLTQPAEGGARSRRVILLYATSLAGALPAGELTGDDVIVVAPFLASSAATFQAQASLLAAGAVHADIAGPAEAAAQLAQLVTSGLNGNAGQETLSSPVLFSNNSAVLLPGAVRFLTELINPLRRPRAAAMINGYASAPGGAGMNYRLSWARANAVERFLEAHGILATSLNAAGHGASDLVAAGSSGANRRVTVVISEPADS